MLRSPPAQASPEYTDVLLAGPETVTWDETLGTLHIILSFVNALLYELEHAFQDATRRSVARPRRDQFGCPLTRCPARPTGGPTCPGTRCRAVSRGEGAHTTRHRQPRDPVPATGHLCWDGTAPASKLILIPIDRIGQVVTETLCLPLQLTNALTDASGVLAAGQCRG